MSTESQAGRTPFPIPGAQATEGTTSIIWQLRFQPRADYVALSEITVPTESQLRGLFAQYRGMIDRARAGYTSPFQTASMEALERVLGNVFGQQQQVHEVKRSRQEVSVYTIRLSPIVKPTDCTVKELLRTYEESVHGLIKANHARQTPGYPATVAQQLPDEAALNGTNYYLGGALALLGQNEAVHALWRENKQQLGQM